MSAFDFQALVHKVMNDESFAESLTRDPEAVLTSAGLQASPEVIDAVKGVDPAAIRKLAGAFKQGQGAAS